MSDMSIDALVLDLKAMLMDSAQRFEPSDFQRQMDTAALDLPRVSPRVVQGTLTLEADLGYYPAPADLLAPIALDWGRAERLQCKPWNADWPGQLPRLSLLSVNGERQVLLTPPPTARQITQLGSAAAYRYSASYTIGDQATDTTVNPRDRHLLLTRALAEAMQDLASRGVSKPVTLGGKAGLSVPKNGAPAELARQLMERFEAMAG